MLLQCYNSIAPNGATLLFESPVKYKHGAVGVDGNPFFYSQ